MGKKDGLQKAMDEMKRGSKRGFKVFYEATIQYVYKYSYALFKNKDDAILFVVEYYPYLYMRINSYTPGDDLKKWMLSLITSRFTELTGKRSNEFGLINNTNILELDKSDLDKIWHLLEMRIHFPVEEKKSGLSTPFKVLITVALLSALALFILYKIAPSIASKTNSKNKSEQETDSAKESIPTVQEIEDMIEAEYADKEAAKTQEAVENMIDNLDYPNMNPNSNIDMSIEDNIPDSLVQKNNTGQNSPGKNDYKGQFSDSSINTFLHGAGQNDSSEDEKETNLEDLQLELKYGEGLYFTQR